MGLVYDIIFFLAAAALSPVWLYKLITTGKWRTDWRGRFGGCDLEVDEDDHRPTLLIHAVSLGEVNAIRLLVERLYEETNDGWRIVISTTTDTGMARAMNLYGERHAVVRYPLDFSFAVKKFLNAVNPDAVALAELEVWPNFVLACGLRHIPVAVINGRLSSRSFKLYRLIGKLVRPTFARLAAAGVQTQDYAARFIALGVPAEKVTVLDSMKWDTAEVADARKIDGANALAVAMGIDRRKPLIVAGSTAPGEDQLLIKTCPRQAQILLVPRKPEWFDDVAKLFPGIVRRTRCTDNSPRAPDDKLLFMLDTMGELRKAYALADVVIVGRSFTGRFYGSDMIEPIALGKPTIVGPHYSDFADVMAAFTAADGVVVSDKPGKAAGELLADKAKAAALAKRGRDVVIARQGATARHVEMVRLLMPSKA